MQTCVDKKEISQNIFKKNNDKIKNISYIIKCKNAWPTPNPLSRMGHEHCLKLALNINFTALNRIIFKIEGKIGLFLKRGWKLFFKKMGVKMDHFFETGIEKGLFLKLEENEKHF